MDECRDALKAYPTTLDRSRDELRRLEDQEPGSIMADVLRVRVQEQKVLHRTQYVLREQKAKLQGKPF